MQKSNKNKRSKTRSVKKRAEKNSKKSLVKIARSVGHLKTRHGVKKATKITNVYIRAEEEAANESKNHKNPLLATENHHQIIIEPKNWITRSVLFRIPNFERFFL